MRFGRAGLQTGAALLLASIAGAPISAQEINLTGVARSISQFAAIRGVCSRYYRVDRPLLEKVIRAMTDIGWNTHGEHAFKAAAATEIPRRQQEIQITGEQQWCAYQRSHMRQQKLNVFPR